jgi:opacity protein-like surface antigen
MLILFVAIWLILFEFLTVSTAKAEFYVGIGSGLSFGGSVNDYENVDTVGPFLCALNFSCENVTIQTGSDLDTDDAFAWGAKTGYFFEESWLGMEFQYCQRNLDVPRQAWSATGTNTSILVPTLPFNGQAAIEMGPLKTFALLLMLRVPMSQDETTFLSRWQPYLGMGLSLNHVKIGPMQTFDSGGNLIATNLRDQSSLGLGWLFSLGLNYKVGAQWKIFGEYKYSDVFSGPGSEFDPGALGQDFGVLFDISDHTFMVGLTYSFGTKPTKKKSKQRNPFAPKSPITPLPPKGEISSD